MEHRHEDEGGKVQHLHRTFGYRLVKGKLELIPEQVPIIRYIYEAYLSGKTAGDIAAALNLFSKGKNSGSHSGLTTSSPMSGTAATPFCGNGIRRIPCHAK